MIRTPWFACLVGLAIAGCGRNSSPAARTTGPTHSGALTKLKITDVKPGTGPGAVNGDQLTMLYTGTLADGTVFDTNDHTGGKPFTFTLGAVGPGGVIDGWNKGLLGMKQGGERKLEIPAALAYGPKSMGDKIPPNSDLYFDVKLTSLTRAADRDTVVITDVKNGSGPALKKGDTAVITYVASVAGGEPFDDRSDPKSPFRFKVGGGEVFGGIDVGVIGMKKGGERKIQIPFGLGPMRPDIPPGSQEIFDVTLRDIKHG